MTSQELSTPNCSANNSKTLCFDDGFGSELFDYDWTKDLGWLFEMDLPCDSTVSSPVPKGELFVLSDAYWDDEEWTYQLARAEHVPMDIMDVVSQSCSMFPTLNSASTSESNSTSNSGSISVSTSSPIPASTSVPTTLSSSVSTTASTSATTLSSDGCILPTLKTTDVNGNCIMIAPVTSSPACKSDQKSSVATPELTPLRLAPKLIPTTTTLSSRDNESVSRNLRRRKRRISFKTSRRVESANRSSISLRVQFPELEATLKDYLANLIRNAKLGKGNVQSDAQMELASITLNTIHNRVMELVPGLVDRGISYTSLGRFLKPLTISLIKNCLRNHSAWFLVNEALHIV